jgi:peptide/nickel transport system permease protein
MTVVLRRLAVVPVLGLVVITIVFALLRLLPTDASKILASQAGGATAAEASKIKTAIGLDASVPRQYWEYLSGLAHLDLGASYYGNVPVLDLLRNTVPVTLELTAAAMIMAILLGISTGIVAAARRNTWLDTSLRGFATVSVSLPWFALGVIFIVIFGVAFNVLPLFGRLSAGTTYSPKTNFVLIDAFIQWDFSYVGDWLRHLILPSLTLAITTAGFIMRITRAAFLDTLSEDYVQTAKMKGMRERRVLVRHVLRNASLPIVTIIGILVGSLLGGAVVTEKVFSYPGVGSLLVDGIEKRDFFVVQGAGLTIALLFILINTLVDVTYVVLDPRLRRT